MKTAIAVIFLLAGIMCMGTSFVWDDLLPPPLTKEEASAFQRSVSIREHILLGTADESDREPAYALAEQMKAKVQAREARKESGEFFFTSVGIALSLIGICIVVATRGKAS
jgi:hypothetical protein